MPVQRSSDASLDPVDLVRRVENLIRKGTIAQVRLKKPARVRVKSGELLTNWIPWLDLAAGGQDGGRHWRAPAHGEQCVLLSVGGDTGQGTTTSTGKPLGSMLVVRTSGDRHRYHTAERGAYTGVRAYWGDNSQAEKRSVLTGSEENEKRLKDTYATEADAMKAAKAEHQRIERGKATLDITLALGRPDLMPQTPVTVQGFKPQIDGQGWLAREVTHTLDDAGLITKVQMERSGEKGAPAKPART